MVVGAKLQEDDNGGSSINAAGIVFVHKCSGACTTGGLNGDSTWELDATLRASDSAVVGAIEGQGFGSEVSIAIHPVTEDVVVAVSSFGSSSQPFSTVGKYEAVFIFTKPLMGTWNETHVEVSADGDDTQFGTTTAFVTSDSGGLSLYIADTKSNGLGHKGNLYVLHEISPSIWQLAPEVYASGTSVSGFYFGQVIQAYDSSFFTTNNGYSGDNKGEVLLLHETFPDSRIWEVDLSHTLTAPDNLDNHNDMFGFNLALNENTFVIGATKSDNGGETESGGVYVYKQISPHIWDYVTKLVDPQGFTVYMEYGYAVGITPSYIMATRYNFYLENPVLDIWSETAADTWEVLRSEPLEPYEATSKIIKATTDDMIFMRAMVDGSTVVLMVMGFDPNDDCTSNLCEHFSTCNDEYQQYSCSCSDVHDGEFCTNCLCENGGICEDDIEAGVSSCICVDTPKYAGNLCHKYCNGGVSDDASLGCDCTGAGATGKFCTADIDDCLSNPCENTGVCTDYRADLFPNHNNEFNCSCEGTGYHGVTCEISDCASSPCLNNGMCEQAYDLDGPSGIKCNCSNTGYEGDWCQTEITECASSPCLNDGDCTDLLGNFDCDCTGTGYEGLTCAMDVDDCSSSPCQNDGVCKDKGADKFTCTCNEFWEGDVCTEDVDDCILKGYYCENGAACSDDPVNMGDVLCDCSTSTGGFTGKYCNVPIEDACVTFNPCFHGGKCIVDDITKEMSCDCRDTGYEGDVCDVQVYVSECVSSPCLNEGQCYDPSDYQDDWYCVCVDNYFGDLCDLLACDSNPCQNGGTCTNDETGEYTCDCADNYSGTRCEVDEDEQAQAESSSSSILVAGPDDNIVDEVEVAKKDDGTLVIIIIVIVAVVIVGGGALFWFHKQQSATKYAMSV